MAGGRSRRARVWELARESGMSPQQVLDRLDQLGHPARATTSTVTGEVAELFLAATRPSPADEPPSDRRSAFQVLAPYVRHRRRGLRNILIATFAASGTALLLPWPLKVLADNILAEGEATGWLAHLPFTGHVSVAIAYVAVASLLLFAAATSLDVWLTTLWVRVGNAMVYELAGDVLRALQRRSILFHSQTAVGDSVSRVMVDSFGLQAALNALVFAPLHAVVLTTAMLILLTSIDAGLTLAAAVTAVLMTLASILLGRSIRRTSRQARNAEADLQSHLHHTLSGVAVVQSFTQERRERLRFDDYVDEIVRARRRSTLFNQLHSFGSGLPGVIGTAVVLWLAVGRVLDHQMPVGSLLLFMSYLGGLTTQVRIIANVNRAWQASGALLDRVRDVLDVEPEIRDRRDARPLAAVRGHLVLDHVSFTYGGDRWALSDVSFEARPGETVALVGQSGAGKTTLVSLVPRMLDPSMGHVFLDGYDLRDVQLHSLRSQVSTVGQDPFLFPVSIAANIAYGRPDASRQEIEAAARHANAHEFIVALPDSYDTIVGERGGTLSGGQRQRVSIARAFLKDAPVLILDEPTSALDAHSERLLLDALRTLMQGRTTLIIAHRLSTIRDADKIVMLEKGQVIEIGTHEQLLSQRGAYAEFYNSQRRRPKRAGTAVAESAS